MKTNNKLVGAGFFTAIAASLCCITPVLALIAGTSGLAASFSWIEPFRPYLIGLTVLVLGFAWYQKLKPAKDVNCDCDMDEKPKFIQSKSFLGIMTVFTVLMLAFPYYSAVFYPEVERTVIAVDEPNIQRVNFLIEGMTCDACAEHINYEVNQLDGILNSVASYQNGNAIIAFDKSKTTLVAIEKVINSTGYSVIGKN